MPFDHNVTHCVFSDRLMGKESAGIVPSNIRNESYYMATHDTWNGTMIQQHLSAGGANPSAPSTGGQDPLDAPTVHQIGGGESLMIEQESPSAPGYEQRSQSTPDGSNHTRESLSSLLDSSHPGFTRDMPGRQSMSEKRHATLDAKATDTYQKRKKARDDR